jgi:hypothetical protein
MTLNHIGEVGTLIILVPILIKVIFFFSKVQHQVTVAILWLLYVINANLWYGTLQLFQFLFSKIPFQLFSFQLMILA